ncbi:MAG: polysaccharide deacetylase family protein [Spirochaetes bacterium]|nr:polysaccharide deacetylase family protein [Spirochaetota bacterium]MBN2770678.1 polysaccharide deacetylase family protein [Spirochaetota bacterium]
MKLSFFRTFKELAGNTSILAVFFVFICTITLILYLRVSTLGKNDDPGFITRNPDEYREIDAIPILLYHDIDGHGPYSITKEQLRKHFEFFRLNNIDVISLKELIRLQDENRSPENKSVAITVDDGYISAYTKILPLMQEFDYPVTLFIYTNFIFDKSDKHMTWAMLKEMEKYGFDIQSHTVSHADLVKLVEKGNTESLNSIEYELTQSKKIIEDKLDKEVTLLAFPYGYYTPKLLDMARNAGYIKTFSTDYGANISLHSNYCYRRHHIKKDFNETNLKKIIQMR